LASDFDYTILNERSHRPWPMPDGPWVMTQSWHDLLFAHWPVPAAALVSKLPPGLTLDLFEGQAWLGIVPFRMSHVTARGVPDLPGLSAFPELNVRTYVRVGDRGGVWFLSLDAANALAVVTARTLFHLPYYRASMRLDEQDGVIEYSSRRRRRDLPAVFEGAYAPAGAVFHPQPGTLEHFLTERYCLYAASPRALLTVDIQHPRWSLQPAVATIGVNTMADAAGVPIASAPALLHFARRQDVVAWAPTAVL
jgi:uncharacterized protein YqjF (DUF2071 family)